MSHDFNTFAACTLEDVEDLPDFGPVDDRPNFIVDDEEEW